MVPAQVITGSPGDHKRVRAHFASAHPPPNPIIIILKKKNLPPKKKQQRENRSKKRAERHQDPRGPERSCSSPAPLWAPKPPCGTGPPLRRSPTRRPPTADCCSNRGGGGAGQRGAASFAVPRGGQGRVLLLLPSWETTAKGECI